MAKQSNPELKLEVESRILDFVNSAECTSDLCEPPFEPFEGEVEFSRKTLFQFDEKTAKKILEYRDKLDEYRFQDLDSLSSVIPKTQLSKLVKFFTSFKFWLKRNIYLKIEEIENYSPVAPVEEKLPPPIAYKRDCMQNMGHPNGIIPDSEVTARSLKAVVYREYLDPDYLVPKTSKLIPADINEPPYHRRVPGTVIYTRPYTKLCIHIKNCASQGYSFHLHGLEYDISSDGAWPFGTQTTDGRRSDEICPGQTWTYIYKVTKEHVGTWPFHDHAQKPSPAINSGLIGGIIVKNFRFPIPWPWLYPKEFKRLKDEIVQPNFNLTLAKIKKRKLPFEVDLRDQREFLNEWLQRELIKPILPIKKFLEAPVFFHLMENPNPLPTFDSGDIEELGGTWSHTFNDPGNYEYFCAHHPNMKGIVRVVAAAPMNINVNIVEAPAFAFDSDDVSVAPGGTVTWTNSGNQHHTVTSAEGGGMQSHCLNGRSFVGNSPTIEGYPGQIIKWYLFNLDVSHNWHNFHPHASRWTFAGEQIDVRSFGPSESFKVETKIPKVVDNLPAHISQLQTAKKKPANAKLYHLKGEFVFHCHVHHHVMNGMIGLVRAKQSLWLTPEMKKELEDTRGLIINDFKNSCPVVDKNRCKNHGEGEWVILPDNPEVTQMHAVLLPRTEKVLYWGYTRNDQSRLYDYSTLNGIVTSPANQPQHLAPAEPAGDSDLWSAEHALFDDADGTVLAHGGLTQGSVRSYLFNPQSELWSRTDDSAMARFYSTTIKLNDEQLMTLYGSGTKGYEIYTPSAAAGAKWSPPVALPWNEHIYYPWTWLLPDGHLFIAGPHVPTRKFDPNNLAATTAFNTNQGDRSSGAEKGSAVMLTLRPPDYEPRIVILGGEFGGTFFNSVEMINLADPAPTWTYLDAMHQARGNMYAILLPDGRIFAAGGISAPAGDGGPSEILDAELPGATWQLGPVMSFHRAYHSSMILLGDGSILAGGDPNSNDSERYFPGYHTQPRPVISNAPASVSYGNTFQIDCPQANTISEVVVMMPGSTTHSWNMTQRRVELVISNITPGQIDVVTPPNGFIAPSGWYQLILVDNNRVPSHGHWIRIN